jgi:hypothetical protein
MFVTILVRHRSLSSFISDDIFFFRSPETLLQTILFFISLFPHVPVLSFDG